MKTNRECTTFCYWVASCSSLTWFVNFVLSDTQTEIISNEWSLYSLVFCCPWSCATICESVAAKLFVQGAKPTTFKDLVWRSINTPGVHDLICYAQTCGVQYSTLKGCECLKSVILFLSIEKSELIATAQFKQKQGRNANKCLQGLTRYNLESSKTLFSGQYSCESSKSW